MAALPYLGGPGAYGETTFVPAQQAVGHWAGGAQPAVLSLVRRSTAIGRAGAGRAGRPVLHGEYETGSIVRTHVPCMGHEDVALVVSYHHDGSLSLCCG